MKNIVIITGSPRKNGNSGLLAKAFMEGAKEAGDNVFLFETADKNLSPCIACETCFSKGQTCSISDDFSGIIPILEKAEVIVFSTPLYWFTFSSQIKMFIDRLYLYSSGKKKLNIKKAVLMVTAATDDINDFDGIIKSFELILNYTKWENAGILAVPNVSDPGDVKKTDGLIKAKELGLNI